MLFNFRKIFSKLICSKMADIETYNNHFYFFAHAPPPSSPSAHFIDRRSARMKEWYQMPTQNKHNRLRLRRAAFWFRMTIDSVQRAPTFGRWAEVAARFARALVLPSTQNSFNSFEYSIWSVYYPQSASSMTVRTFNSQLQLQMRFSFYSRSSHHSLPLARSHEHSFEFI